MDFISIIGAAANQAWSAISTFAVINSQSLLATLGFATSPVAVKAAVLIGIALVAIAVIALVLYLSSTMLGKIFGNQSNSNVNHKNQKQHSDLNEDVKPKPIVSSQLNVMLAQDEALSQEAKDQIELRNKAIKELDQLAPEDKMLDAVIELCESTVQATKTALDSAEALLLVDPDQQALIEERRASYASAQLYLQYAKKLDANSKKLYEASQKAQMIYNGTKPAGGGLGNDQALGVWHHAYEVFEKDFDTIKAQLESIKDMDPEDVNAALDNLAPPESPKGNKPKK